MKLYQSRGWHAVMAGRTLKRSLPGDTPAVVVALHAANDAGLLVSNAAVPSVCTGCRAESIAEGINDR